MGLVNKAANPVDEDDSGTAIVGLSDNLDLETLGGGHRGVGARLAVPAKRENSDGDEDENERGGVEREENSLAPLAVCGT